MNDLIISFLPFLFFLIQYVNLVLQFLGTLFTLRVITFMLGSYSVKHGTTISIQCGIGGLITIIWASSLIDFTFRHLLIFNNLNTLIWFYIWLTSRYLTHQGGAAPLGIVGCRGASGTSTPVSWAQAPLCFGISLR